MATFETEMKRAYGEALAPYGFKKVKGRYPYFVRMVGEEILQVITYYKNKGLEPEQVFEMRCGITTVYTKEINLECSPKDNDSWLYPYRNIYIDSHPILSRENIPNYSFRYEMPEELYMQRLEKARKQNRSVPRIVSPYPLPTMQEAIEHTLDLTRKEIIPVFDTVTDLKTCAEYYRRYGSGIMDLYSDLFSPSIYDNTCQEALFNFKVYNSIDEFKAAIEKESKWIKERLFYKIKRGYEMDYGGLRLGRKK